MKNFFLVLFLLTLYSNSHALGNSNIIKNFNAIENLSFKFEQNINGKIENGQCVIEYPKKIYCNYDLKNKKVLVSNGRSLVIKTLNSYYIYPIEKTPLNLILNKEFLLDKIKDLNEKFIKKEFINYKITHNENEINLFFDKKTYDLIGWQTLDIYQNSSTTFLSSIKKNQKIKKNLFRLPSQN